jgi:hypothetical protein
MATDIHFFGRWGTDLVVAPRPGGPAGPWRKLTCQAT